MTRKISLFVLLTSLLATTAAWAVTLMLFQATMEGTAVRLEWEVASEAGLTGFELFRKSATDQSFNRIGTFVPSGQRRYQHLDGNLYRGVPGSTPQPANAGGPYTYRLVVKTINGDQHYTTVLSQTPSAVQRSWGSIKSMFR